MKRHETDQDYFSLPKMFDAFARRRGVDVCLPRTQEDFCAEIAAALRVHLETPSRMNGFRVESMFAHVAAALGESLLITEEDSGTWYHDSRELKQRPDFRIVLRDGAQFLVEVKHHLPKKPFDDYVISRKYHSCMTAYAAIMKIPLKFAIYWAHFGVWTLIDASDIKFYGGSADIKLTEVFKINQMSLLGDLTFGVMPPLAIRFHADQTKARSVLDDMRAHFTIGNVTFHISGKEITDEFEKKLAWFLLNYGTWEIVERPCIISDNLLDYFDIEVTRENVGEAGGFTMIGNYSQMLSRQYNSQTEGDDILRPLVPSSDPSMMGVVFPKHYKGEVLKMFIGKQVVQSK